MIFNDFGSTEDSVIAEIDRICGSNDSSYSLKAKTARVNQALDEFYSIVFMYDKNWSFDDINQSDLPIGTTNLIAGRQDYPFALEFLSIKGAFAKDPQGFFHELTIEDDAQNTLLLPTVTNGIPSKFRIFGTSILLDSIPNYNSQGGLKVNFSRAALKFTSVDFTRTLGIPIQFHKWICEVASAPFVRKNRPEEYAGLLLEIEKKKNPQLPDSIPSFMANRNQIRKPRLGIKIENNR